MGVYNKLYKLCNSNLIDMDSECINYTTIHSRFRDFYHTQTTILPHLNITDIDIPQPAHFYAPDIDTGCYEITHEFIDMLTAEVQLTINDILSGITPHLIPLSEIPIYLTFINTVKRELNLNSRLIYVFA